MDTILPTKTLSSFAALRKLFYFYSYSVLAFNPQFETLDILHKFCKYGFLGITSHKEQRIEYVCMPSSQLGIKKSVWNLEHTIGERKVKKSDIVLTIVLFKTQYPKTTRIYYFSYF